jgi:parallel beta-helix repeat protein
MKANTIKILFILLISNNLFSQVGIGTITPQGALDIISTNDGLLIPRIALTATNIATVSTPTVSEMVYNTATSVAGPNQVVAGFYYWNGSLWVKVSGNSVASEILTFSQFSQRPTNLTTTDAGKKYLYSQTGNFHLWTGSAWQVLNESIINVKDYGAIGDGVADDTLPIQSAVNLGKSCFFPEGTFKLNGINLKSNCMYYGVSNQTVIDVDEKDVGANNYNVAFNINNSSNVKIKNLTIKSSKYDITPKPIAYALCGISVYLSTKVLISDINIINFANYGIFVSGTSTVNSEDVVVENCYLDNWSSRDTGSAFGAVEFGQGSNRCIARNNKILCASTFGIVFSDFYRPGESKNHQAIDNIVENQISYGILLYNQNQPIDGHNYVVTGNKIKNIQGSYSANNDPQKSFGAGIYSVSCKNIQITNNYIENTNIFTTQGGSLAEGNIGISDTLGQIIISGNICKKSGCYGIYMVNCLDGAVVEGNSISDSKNETLFFLNCNRINCSNNKITAKSNTIRTPLTIITVNNSNFNNNSVFYDAATTQDATYIKDSNYINFSNNFIEMTSSNAYNRFDNNDYLTFSNNIYKLLNSTAEILWFKIKNTNSKIIGNTFINNGSLKLLFDGITTNTFVDKSNRVPIVNISNFSTGLTIDN